MTRLRRARLWRSLLLEPDPLDALRWRIRDELPWGQARVALALLCQPDDAVGYPEVAAGLGIHLGTVHTHLRRIRLRHPELYVQLMAERRRQLAVRRRLVAGIRRERSLRWGRRRYAARYRQEHGRWPWVVMRDG